MRKFDLSKLGEGVVVNCKTEKDANAFLEYLDSEGIRWGDNTKIVETVGYNFHTYNEQTCFIVINGRLLYSPREWYKEKGYKILDLSEIEIVKQPSEQEILNKTKEYNSKLIIKERKMRKFDLGKFGKGVAINCKTEDDARDFLLYLHSKGITWNGGSEISEMSPTYEEFGYQFNRYQGESCFSLERVDVANVGLSYCYKIWYENDGYKILDLSEIEIFEETPEIVEQPSEQEILNKTKEYNSKLIPQCNFQKSHHIHYIKFPLTENLSIRYFFSFQNQPEKVGKFYMKNHKEKTYSEIDIETMKELLSNFCKEKGVEIIGRRVGKNYRKVIISEGVLISEIE